MKLQGVWYGALLVMVVIGFLNIGAVDGAVGMYVFGDSSMDTGNAPQLSVKSPYGSTWPGFPDNRRSDGRVQTDYFAKLFNLPTPTPFLLRHNLSQALQGINFAVGGSGVTYGYGITPLDEQVGNMEALVASGVLTKAHLRNSVGFISSGLNDYDSRNSGTPFQVSKLAPLFHDSKFFLYGAQTLWNESQSREKAITGDGWVDMKLGI